MSVLKKTPLYAEHLSLGGRLVPFAGFEMPVQYAGVIAEHVCVRQNVGLFDVSHMGEFLISGAGARIYLNRLLTNDVMSLVDGRSQYTLMCDEYGTVVDDLIISRLSADSYLAVVNAANIQKDFAWMEKNIREQVTLRNVSDEKCLLAVQGPRSEALMTEVFGRDFSGLKTYGFVLCEPLKKSGTAIFISRTGYTGEDGFEIMVDNEGAVALWRLLLDAGKKYGIQPIGLGARDTLRLEACYSLYGHEISHNIDPLTAGLSWVVKLGKGDFIGREALMDRKKRGLEKKIVALEMLDPCVPREEYKVYSPYQLIGYLTSGTHSPLLKKGIALALVPEPFAYEGTELKIDVRGKFKKARVVKKPFYKRGDHHEL